MEDLESAGYDLFRHEADDQADFDLSDFDPSSVPELDLEVTEQMLTDNQTEATEISAVQGGHLDPGLPGQTSSHAVSSQGMGYYPVLNESQHHLKSQPSLEQLEDFLSTDHANEQSSGISVTHPGLMPLLHVPAPPFKGAFAPSLSSGFSTQTGLQYLQLPTGMDTSSMLQATSAANLVLQQDGLPPGIIGSSSSFNKPRLRWTDELHDKFIDAVENLGGYQHATPSAILKAMDVDKLELSHVKSHLQKYRTEKKRSMEKEEREKKAASQKKLKKEAPRASGKGQSPAQSSKSKGAPSSKAETPAEAPAESEEVAEPVMENPQTDIGGAVLEAALKKQFELQQMLAEQLEAQKKLQSSLEQHTKYISCLMQDKYNAGSEQEEVTQALLMQRRQSKN